MPGAAPPTWVLADDRPGNANQALGVAEALGWPFEVKRIGYRAAARLPNLLLGASLLGVDAVTRSALQPPWPALVIGAGRRTVPVAAWLKRQNPQAFLAQLMWPGAIGPLDLVAVPEHDGLARRDPRILRTLGAPHRVSAARLREAATRPSDDLAALPAPRIACLVGGSSRHAAFTPDDAAALAAGASELARARGGSLLVTTSRRTGAACEAALAAGLDAPHRLHRWQPRGDNPYLDWLAAAAAVIVTGDSASMCTEACGTGRPVFLYRLQAGTPAKLARLQEALIAAGRLQVLGAPWPAAMPPPLNPADTVAASIRARFLGPKHAAIDRTVAVGALAP